MILDRILKILSIILAVLSLLSFAWALFQTHRKKKQGANSREVIDELTMQLEQHSKRDAVLNKIPCIIKETEQVFKDVKNPIAKLTYCVTRLQNLCVEQGIIIEENILKNKVEDYLSTPQKKEKESTEVQNGREEEHRNIF